jgi:hypothetical protein
VKLQDNRKPDWFWAQNELFDVFLPLIGAKGVVVYMAMCRLLPERIDGRLSLREIQDSSRVSKSEVGRLLRVLVTLGMIAEKTSGPKSRSAFELLDLRAAAEVGTEELKRRLTLLQTRDEALSEAAPQSVPEVKSGTDASVPPRDRLSAERQCLRGSPQNPSVPPRDRLPVPGTDSEHLSHRGTDGPKRVAQSELFLNTNAEREREDACARGDASGKAAALDLVGIAGLIVLAHPRAQMRNWTENDVLYADRMAAIEAARAEGEREGTSPEEAALTILEKIERIAREVPRDQWRFLKEIDKFLRLREYRMQPNDLYRSANSAGAPHAHTQPNQQHQPSGVSRSPATQRGVESRTNIAAARERRLHRYAVAAHGRDASTVPQSGASGGNSGHVHDGLGEDGPPLRAA